MVENPNLVLNWCGEIDIKDMISVVTNNLALYVSNHKLFCLQICKIMQSKVSIDLGEGFGSCSEHQVVKIMSLAV